MPWKTFLSRNQKPNTKQTTNQNTKKNKKQNTKKQRNHETKKKYQENKDKQNRFSILRGALFLWFLVLVFEWLHRHDRRAQARSASHPAEANPPFSSRELPTPQKQPPILEPKRGGGGCFGGLSKQRPCLTQECSLGPKNRSSTENAGAALAFLFFCFFGSLVFGFLVLCFFWFWFYCGKGYISRNQNTTKTKKHRTEKTKKQKAKEPNNHKTKGTKNQQKQKTVPAFSVELWFFGFCGFGRRVVLHGHVRRAQTRYPGKSTNTPVGAMFCRGRSVMGGGVTIYYIYIYILIYVNYKY